MTRERAGNIRIADSLRYDYTQTFEVVVGALPNQQRFTVHKDVACDRSKFFAAARSERWTTGSAKAT